MRRSRILIWALLGGAVLVLPPARATIQQDYLLAYVQENEAERLEKQGELRAALRGYEACDRQLQKIRAASPQWEPDLVDTRLAECRARIADLQARPETHRAIAEKDSATPTDSTPATAPQNYLQIYLEMSDAAQQRSRHPQVALREFEDSANKLEKLRADNPGWETVLINSRLEDCHTMIADLKSHVGDASASSNR